MLRKRTYFLMIFALVISLGTAFSQVPEGYMRDFEYLDNGDTLITHRYYGDWWFGGFAGPNLNLFFGDLFSRDNPNIADPNYSNKISFQNTFGGGFYFGGLAEYRPRNQHWGYSLGVSFLDRKAFSALSQQFNDSLKTQYEMRSVLDYLIISPGVKYYSSLSGLYYFSSLDIGFNTGASSKQRRKFINSADIDHWLNLPSVDGSTRMELNLGVGYEFIIADFAGRARVLLNPYASLNMGTKLISTLESNWNAIGFKIGLAMKIGPDYREFETFNFDPSYEEPIIELARIELAGIEFPGFKHSNPLPPINLAMVEIPEIMEEITEVETSEFSEDLRVSERGQIRTRVVPNQLYTFSFDKPETTTLSREVEQYLDILSEYLKSNPNLEVRITGHSDNQGSLPQNTQRAINRANNARAYLIKKGIPGNRILTTGRGALIPVAPNDTPANQRKNRRVEIVVVGR